MKLLCCTGVPAFYFTQALSLSVSTTISVTWTLFFTTFKLYNISCTCSATWRRKQAADLSHFLLFFFIIIAQSYSVTRLGNILPFGLLFEGPGEFLCRKSGQKDLANFSGTAHFKNVNDCLNTSIYSYLETSGGQSLNLYLNVVHFFNTSAN